MSYRPNTKPFPVVTNGDMSAVSITSAVTILDSMSRFAYQVKWSGTSPVGTIAIQASNDYALNPDGTVAVAGTWSAMTFLVSGTPSSSASVSGNTGNGFFDIWETGAYAVRLVYTKVSGTGTLQATIKAGVA